MIRPAIILTAFCTSAAAEELTQDFLEAPGMVWVATDFPEYSKQDQMPFLIPFLTFADGQYESGLLSGEPSIYERTCDSPWTCPNRTTRGAVLQGTYVITDYGIEITDAADPGWAFSASTSGDQFAIASHALYGGFAKLERRGERLEQTISDEVREYVRLPETLQHAPLYLSYMVEQQPDINYPCSLRSVLSLAETPENEQTELQRQLNALLKITTTETEAQHQQRILEGIEDGGGALTQAQIQQKKQLEAVTSVTSLLRGFASPLMSSAATEVPQDAIEQARQMVQFMTMTQRATPEAVELFEELTPDAIAAAPLLAKIMTVYAEDDSMPAIQTVLCPTSD